MADGWCLIFSDGTGQRGVRDDADLPVPSSTNIFQMYAAADGTPGMKAFYDPGLGAPEEEEPWRHRLGNLWSKATGWGITTNIEDCYEGLMLTWTPGAKVGLFGFSRGAYTARCLGGVLGTCGIATADENGAPFSPEKEGPAAKRRRAVAQAAVAAYKVKDEAERKKAGKAFAGRYKAEAKAADVIGVFDTVRSLGLPGVTNLANPWKHEFHNKELSTRVPVGLHALSVDENRKAFLPVLWDDPDAEALARGQVIEQVWFPGVHSDIGGGYEDRDLANLTLAWMLERLEETAGLRIPLVVNVSDELRGGTVHNERTGFGKAWLPARRSIDGKTVDIAALCREIESRFDHAPARYRPEPLRDHPRVKRFY